MEGSSKKLVLENEITLLKKRLDTLVDTDSVNSKEVLELSEELDILIVGYYSLKCKAKV